MLTTPPQIESKPVVAKRFPWVILLVVFAFLALAVLAFSLGRNNSLFSKTCDYNGSTYQLGQGFKSTDNCNSCSCSENGVICTMMACLVTPTGTITAPVTPTLTPFSIYFGKPDNEADYNTIATVERDSDTTGTQSISFLLGELITGPSISEQSQGFTPVMELNGDSVCGGSSYQFNRNGDTLTVKFCKNIDYVANPGEGGGFAGIGLAGNGRILRALTRTLQTDGVTKVIVKNPDNSCFAKDTGLNQDCTP